MMLMMLGEPELNVFTFEALTFLPFMYLRKMWQAHHEFMEDLLT